jgi:hypothetical protein
LVQLADETCHVRRLSLLAAAVGLDSCGLRPWPTSSAPEDDVDCGDAPPDLVVGRLVGQERRTFVHRDVSMTVRVDDSVEHTAVAS